MGARDEAHKLDANEDIVDDDKAGHSNDSISGNDDKKSEAQDSEGDHEGKGKAENLKPRSKRRKCTGNYDERTEVENSEDECEESSKVEDQIKIQAKEESWKIDGNEDRPQ